jgi:hypothetical protein
MLTVRAVASLVLASRAQSPAGTQAENNWFVVSSLVESHLHKLVCACVRTFIPLNSQDFLRFLLLLCNRFVTTVNSLFLSSTTVRRR